MTKNLKKPFCQPTYQYIIPEMYKCSYKQYLTLRKLLNKMYVRFKS